MVYQKPLTVEEICNKLRPVFGKKIDEIYFQYTVADGREEREEIVHVLNALYQKNLNRLLDKGVLLEPPRQELIDGDYPLATISYANKKLFDFKLREKDWPRHVCVTGMSGSGKTTFAFKIVETLNAHKKPYLIFDWKKSFRPLIAKDNEIQIFTVGDEKVSNLFKTNINRPPKGVAPKEWINVLSDLLTESFSASFGVHKVILETLDEAFKEWGIYHGSENYPTWNHIKWRLEEKMNKMQGREAGWMESALRIATVMTFGEFGKTVNYKGEKSISVEELLNKKVIMELNSLGSIEKTFFCEYILTYIYKLKKARQNSVAQKFDHAIIVDEAHNIFLKKPTNFANETVTDMIYREMREYGTSLICLDQHVSKISDTVKGNSACHIAFQQQLPQDIYEISEIMQLRENRHYFSQLPVGNAIVKLAERYTLPFLIEVPYVEMRNQIITDEDIKSRMQAMELGRDFENETDPEFNEAIENPETTQETKVVEVEPIQKPVSTTISEDKSNLTEVQKAIHEFVTESLKAGVELKEIEKTLEQSKTQGNYTTSDIMTVINEVFENQLTANFKNSDVTTKYVQSAPTDNVQKSVRVQSTPADNVQKSVRVQSGLSPDEQVFIEFLQKNPTHTMSTVEVYRQTGLSARKGTNIKNALQEKGLIKIEEVKYDKGWKKLIRLA
jgi:uridine kinase